MAELIGRWSNDYLHWTGRALCMLVLYLLSMAPAWTTDIVTASFLLLTITLMPLIGWGSAAYRTYSSLVLISTPLFLLTTPAAGEILWWGSGAASYLYPLACDLFFLLPYARWVRDPSKSPFGKQPALFVPFWIAAGIFGLSTNENTGPAILLLAASWLIITLCARKTPPLALWLGIIIAAVASATLILAPGNNDRLDAIHQLGIYPDIPRIATQLALILIPHLFILAAIATLKITRRLPFSATLIPSSFVAASMASACALIFAPYIEPRALTGTAALLVIALLSTMRLLFDTSQHPHAQLHQIANAGIIITAAYFGLTLGLYHYPLTHIRHQVETYARCKSAQLPLCSVKRLPGDRGFIQILGNFSNPGPDPAHWANKCLARYYGLTGITGVE
jgi:hypothetical protein